MKTYVFNYVGSFDSINNIINRMNNCGVIMEVISIKDNNFSGVCKHAEFDNNDLKAMFNRSVALVANKHNNYEFTRQVATID